MAIRYYTRRSLTRTVETRRMAQRLTRRGWRRCCLAVWRETRRRRDLARLADLPPIGAVAPKAGAVLERLPNGYARFQV